jgi:hypothetical protein
MTPQLPDTRFSGRWIGETQGYEMPAHIWDIAQHGALLVITMRWENETSASRMDARVLADEPAFTIGSHKATLVDPQHFIIPEWDTNDTRGGEGLAYDVVFSRPGIAELTATAIWRRARVRA